MQEAADDHRRAGRSARAELPGRAASSSAAKQAVRELRAARRLGHRVQAHQIHGRQALWWRRLHGRFAAYNTACAYRDTFGAVAGVFPPLNLRRMSDSGSYRDRSTRTTGAGATTSTTPTGHRQRGLTKVRIGLVGPLYGVGRTPSDALARNRRTGRPREPATGACDVRRLWGQDEFNITPRSGFLYCGSSASASTSASIGRHHDKCTAVRLLPSLFEFLNHEVGCYAPIACCDPCDPCGPCTTGACREGACSRIK